MSFIPACFEMAGTILIAPKLLGIPLLDAAMLAAVVASASPAVIVPRMLKLMEIGYGTGKRIPQLILASDSVDDIFNIAVFTSLLGLTGGEEISALRFAGVPLSILSGILAGVLTGFLLAKLFKRVRLRDSLKAVVMLSTAFLLVSAEEFIGESLPFSGLLAVMAAGVILLRAAPDTAKRLSAKLSKLWAGAEILLFALVGASVNISYASEAGFKTVILLAVVLCIRAVGILVCLIGTSLNPRERAFCAVTGIPKATVQAAIGGIPMAMGLPNGEIILAVAVISVLLTAPLGAFVIDSTYKRLLERNSNLH